MTESAPMSPLSPRTTWGVGDYPAMATRLLPAAVTAVASVRVRPDDIVVDLACGTGNGALLSAERGAKTFGVDLEPSLLAVARARAEAAGVSVSWIEGDVCRIPLVDAQVTVALSLFGVMYAADAELAAAEIGRVCRQDARVVLATWAPTGFMPAMGQIAAKYLPPPPVGSGRPARWSEQNELARLLAPAGLSLPEPGPSGRVVLDFETSDEAAGFLINTAGHLLAERTRLEHEGRWTALVSDLRDLAAERSTSRERCRLELEYDIALARKR